MADFANSRLNDIWESVRQTLTVPARPWFSSNSDEPTILKVLDVRPLRVLSAMWSIKKRPQKVGYEFASINLEVELDVIARYTTRAILLNRTEFSLSAEREYEPVEYRGHGHKETPATLTRTVSVEVEIKLDGDRFADIAVIPR